MNEIFPVELSKPAQKAQHIRRLLEIEKRIKNQVGLNADLQGVRQAALDKFTSERRSEEQNKRRRHDKHFDILNRNAYDEDLDKVFGNLFPTPEAFHEKKEILEKIHIIRFDMKMLNYFNSLSRGEAAGDDYKKAVAKIIGVKTPGTDELIKKEGIEYRGYLIGGDEFAVITVGNNKQVEELAKRLQTEIASIKKPDDSLVNPHVDFGIANLEEVFGEFRLMEDSQNTVLSIQNIEGERIKMLKLLDGLADRRSKINKFLERIQYLVKEFKSRDSTTFFKLHASATKSADMISLTPSLLDRIGQSEKMAKQWVSDYYEEKDDRAIRENDDLYQRFAIAFNLRKTKDYLHA